MGQAFWCTVPESDEQNYQEQGWLRPTPCTIGNDPPTIYSHLNLSGGHQQIVNGQEMWQTKYFKIKHVESANFNSKSKWDLERRVFSVNYIFFAKK